MGCVQCERPLAIAISAARSYHGLVADLDAPTLAGIQNSLNLYRHVWKSFRDRNEAIVELTVRESTHKKPGGGLQLSRRQSA